MCCSIGKNGLWLGALAVMLGVGVAIGSLLNKEEPTSAGLSNELVQQLFAKADSASSSKSLSMATGHVDSGVDGIFVLDHATGNLFCWVVNPKGGGIVAQYMANVQAAMGPVEQGKATEYVMVTGNMDSSGGNAGNGKPAGCVCYVGDATSGKVIGYSFLWNRSRAASGGAQVGEMIVVLEGLARPQNLVRE